MQTFIVVITNKLNIGLTAIPYYAKISDNKPIKLIEQVTIEHLKREDNLLAEDENEAVVILNKISENHLYKMFSRDKNSSLMDFLSNFIYDDRYEKIFFPYIQNVIYKAITFLSTTEIPVFYKEDTFTQIYLSEQLKPILAEPHFYFNLENETLTYELVVKEKDSSEKQAISIISEESIIITNNPLSTIINGQLIFFEEMDDKKIKPFLSKKIITIQSQFIDQYMKGFIKNTLQDFRQIHHSGFDIQYDKAVPTPSIKIENDLYQNALLQLYFTYNDNKPFLAHKGPKIIVNLTVENGKYSFVKTERNSEKEESFINFLEENGLKRIGNSQFRPENIDDNNSSDLIKSSIAEWLANNSEKLEKEGFIFTQENSSEKIYIGTYKLHTEIIETRDWFELKASLLIGEFVIPFYKFKKHILEGNAKFTLPNKEIFMIPPQWFSKYEEIFIFAKTNNKKIEIPRSHFSLIDDNFEKAFTKISKQSDIDFTKIEVPETVNAKLRPYQIEGFNWLNFLYQNRLGGILADDMGLGKTIQTLSMLDYTYSNCENAIPEQPVQSSLFDLPTESSFNNSNISASLIVMPTSLIHNWIRETEKFTPHLKVYNYTGANRLKSKDIGKIFRHYHIVLTTYGILRNDIEYLKSYTFNYAILDESQYVKNPQSKIYEAINLIDSNYKLVLTGTPIENSLIDLWAQMNFVNPGLLGTLAFFRKQFVIPITRSKSEKVEEKLQTLIQPFFLRRTKDKVAKDLPPRVDQVIYCEMTEAQKSYYETEKSKIRNTLLEVFEENPQANHAIRTLEALTKLRQIANHPAMIDEEYDGDSGKFEQILDSLEYILSENHNVLIFSSYVRDLKILERELISRNHPYSMLIGETQNRERVIDEFNREKRVFLSTIKAGGTGLNLTKADYVFILNPWWNPASEEQAISRAHRIGQEAKVFVYKFISVDTIEEKIAKLQEEKQQLADKFITENNLLKEFNKEEILRLFS